jgi:hypothetical protein
VFLIFQNNFELELLEVGKVAQSHKISVAAILCLVFLVFWDIQEQSRKQSHLSEPNSGRAL